MLLDGLLDKCGYIHRIGGAGEQKNSSPALCIILGVTLWAIVFQIRRSEGKLKRGKMLTHEAETMLASVSPYLLDVEKTVILQKTESIFIAFLLFISQKI